MKKIVNLLIISLLVLSFVLSGCEKKEAGTTEVDAISMENLAYLFTDMTDLGLENYARISLTEEELGMVIGNYDFHATFQEGITIAPMINADPFALAFFRLAPDQDAEAFARSLEENANPRKWVCVSAEKVKAVAVSRTVMFYMCSEKAAAVFDKTFETICQPGFRVEDNLKHPLKDLSARGFYDKLYEQYSTELYGFLDGADLGTSQEGMPQGFQLPAGLESAELLWDLSTNEGDEWDPARASFVALVKTEAANAETAQALYDALQTVVLPMGADPMFCVAYAPEHGMYFLFAGSGSWAYSAYAMNDAMVNLYRMSVVLGE